MGYVVEICVGGPATCILPALREGFLGSPSGEGVMEV